MNERPTRTPYLGAAVAGAEHDRERSTGPRPVANVYLHHPNAAGENRRLGQLARLLRLELYSSALLTRKNRAELTVLAVMLLGVFCFELLAWSFFLNGIFVGGMLDLHPLGTTAAVGLGFLFAATILYFERQVVTADATRLPKRKRRDAWLLRLAAILVAGFIVAHAIDLIAFRVPVQQVLHREAIQAKARVLEADLREKRKEDGRRNFLRSEIASLNESLGDLRNRRDNGQAIAENLRRAAESGQQVEQSVLDDLLRIEARFAAGGATDREVRTARQRADRASEAARSGRGQYSRSLVALQSLDDEIAELQDEKRARGDELRLLVTQDATKAAVLEALESRARRWLSAVAEERPTSDLDYADYVEELTQYPESDIEQWPKEWRDPLRLDPPKASFFERLERIYGLIFGGPEFSSAPQTGSSLLAESPVAEPAGRGLNLFYLTVFASIHFAAMLIPFLVLAVKWLLLPKEVDAYFSTWHQAFAGDPEARLMLSVEEKVRREKELW